MRTLGTMKNFHQEALQASGNSNFLVQTLFVAEQTEPPYVSSMASKV